MQLYERISTQVRAIRYLGPKVPGYDVAALLAAGIKVRPNEHWGGACGHAEHHSYYVLTLWVEKARAWAPVHPGDWIIQEADASGFYPCAQDTFFETYRPVQEAGAQVPDQGRR